MTEDERQEAKDKLLMAEIANKTADTALKNEQRRWEMTKAVAAFAAGVAVFGGLVLGVANLLHPPQSQTFIFPPGTTITVPANPAPK